MPDQQTDFLVESFLAPESGISDNDLQSILAIISFFFDNFTSKDFITYIHRSWITNDNIFPLSSFGLFRPNEHLWIVPAESASQKVPIVLH